MLLVVNLPYGPDSHQVLVPQSMSPVGYCPLSTRPGLVRSSNVTVLAATGVAVFVGFAVAVAVGGTAVLVGVGLGWLVVVVPGSTTRLSKFVSQPLVLLIV